jgi:hypothetical protein
LIPSLDKLFKIHLPLMSKFRSCILKSDWDSEILLSRIRIPVLFAYVTMNSLIIPAVSRNLYSRFEKASWKKEVEKSKSYLSYHLKLVI